MWKRLWLLSGIVIATALVATACTDIGDDERRGEGPGEKVSLDQLPPPVRATVEREAAGGQIREIVKDTERGQTSYEVKIARNGQESEVRIAPDGTKVKTESREGRDDD